MYIYFCIRRCIIGVGLCGYGVLEVPLSVICRLETQENQWYYSVQIQRFENGGLMVYVLFWVRMTEPGAPMSKSRRWMPQLKQKGNLPSPAFLFYFGPQWLGDAPFIGEGDFLYQWFKCYSLPRTLTDKPRNSVFTAIWACLSLIKMT